MRPVPIDDSSVPEGARRIIVGAPDGSLIHDGSSPDKATAVEAVVDADGFHVLIAMEPEDFTALADQAKATGQACFWLNFHAPQMPVFSFFTPTIVEGDDAATE